jgi:hypothetical protein
MLPPETCCKTSSEYRNAACEEAGRVSFSSTCSKSQENGGQENAPERKEKSGQLGRMDAALPQLGVTRNRMHQQAGFHAKLGFGYASVTKQ